MGFIKINQEIEDWLEKLDIAYQKLTDKEYIKISKAWVDSFGEEIVNNNFIYHGEKAMTALEIKLPFTGFIFNLTGSKLLPAASPKGNAYGYSVINLTNLDKLILNSNDAIVSDRYFEYSCIYTHEWQALALPKYYESFK